MKMIDKYGFSLFDVINKDDSLKDKLEANEILTKCLLAGLTNKDQIKELIYSNDFENKLKFYTEVMK